MQVSGLMLPRFNSHDCNPRPMVAVLDETAGSHQSINPRTVAQGLAGLTGEYDLSITQLIMIILRVRNQHLSHFTQ